MLHVIFWNSLFLLYYVAMIFDDVTCCYSAFTLLIIFYCVNIQFINPFSNKWAFELFPVLTIGNSIMDFFCICFLCKCV